MRIRRIISGLLIVLSTALAVLVSLPGPPPEKPVYIPEPPPPLDELIPQGMRPDNMVTLRVLMGGETVEMDMERYLIGVVAAEMPVTFGVEAIKAQAVAARTNALYNSLVRPKANHPGADVCTDMACCTAFLQDELLRGRWGYSYVENISKLINAILKTSGEYVEYEGEPILAVFHSSSAVRTESSGNVWTTDLPYLVSVNSPETAEHVPGFVNAVTVSRSEFIEVVKSHYPDADFSGAEDSWITEISFTEGRRVYELNIGGVPVKGTMLRSMFKLRSTAVSMKWIDGSIVFTTTGFGHGVGMSQYGANVMAKSGMDYKGILSAYYTDTHVVES